MEQSIAQIILQQLGGNRFKVMTGAKNFMTGGNDLHFRIPGNLTLNGINAVRITLDPSDTYTVIFSKIRGYNIKEIATFSDVYCDNLREIFENTTGLRTHLYA